MVYAMLTIAFHMLMFFWHQPKGTVGKAYGLLPAALVVALLVLMPVTSLMNMYYTQYAFTRQVGSVLRTQHVGLQGCRLACVGAVVDKHMLT
jgi:hypothetical protein